MNQSVANFKINKIYKRKDNYYKLVKLPVYVQSKIKTWIVTILVGCDIRFINPSRLFDGKIFLYIYVWALLLIVHS